MEHIVNAECRICCRLYETLYRTEISVIALEKLYFLLSGDPRSDTVLEFFAQRTPVCLNGCIRYLEGSTGSELKETLL